MSSTDTEQVMPVKLAWALANPLFPALDSTSRSGRRIGLDRLDSHAFLMDLQEYLEESYACYNIELIRASEGFFYLHLRSTTLIPRSVLLELDTIVGKTPCYPHLNPERLADGGIFTQWELYDELFTLADETKPLKLVNNHSTGSDADRQKLQEKVYPSPNRLCRLGMVWFMSHDNSKFRTTESVFRFGADVCVGDDPCEAQHRLICDGEAMPIGNHLQFSDETEENQPDSGEEE